MSAPMPEGKVAAPPAPLMTETRTAVVGALIVALGSVSMSLYTPAMPALVEAFQTTPATVKLTLTVYFGGFAFAQLVCGPLSDAFGRRPVALGFFSVYLLGSVVAAVSPAIAWLVVGRMLQGIGVAAGIAISRAIVRDQFTGQQSARIMNLIGLMLTIGPAVSPALGGVILGTVGWHAIFLVMVAYGLVVVLVLGFGVRETNRTPDPTRARPGQIARNYLILLRDRGFMRAGLLLGLMLGGIYTLAVLLPFVMIDRVGLTPTQFGLAMICQTGSYMLGAAGSGCDGPCLAPHGGDAPHSAWRCARGCGRPLACDRTPAGAALVRQCHGSSGDLGFRGGVDHARNHDERARGLSDDSRSRGCSDGLSADRRWAGRLGRGRGVLPRSVCRAHERSAGHGGTCRPGAFCSSAQPCAQPIRGRARRP